MPAKHRTVRRQKSQPARRIRGSILPAGRRSLYEQLKDRRVLDGTYFDTLADDVAGTQGALQTITSALKNVQNAVNMPLINQPLQKILRSSLGPVKRRPLHQTGMITTVVLSIGGTCDSGGAHHDPQETLRGLAVSLNLPTGC